MGNGVVIPAAASAATSGAGTPAAAKETASGAVGEAACAAVTGLVRRRWPRGVDGRSTGRADKKNLRTRVAVFRRPPRPWKPARSSAAYDRRASTAAPGYGSSRQVTFKAPDAYYRVLLTR